MLARCNLSTKYKTFSKSVQRIKNALTVKQESVSAWNKPKILKEFFNTSQINKSLEHLNTNYVDKYRNALYTIQNNLQEKYSFLKKDDKRTAKCKTKILQKTNFNNLALGGAISSAAVLHTVDDPIPEPPPIPEVSEEVLNQINVLGEPTFASLGLGGWTPVGIVQNCLEYLHVSFGVPWWEVICIGTLVIRIMMFPLVVIAQQNAAKMNNYLPQLQLLQLKMTEARQTGNQLDAARYSQEMMYFLKEKKLNPFKNMIVPLAQMPVFISFFVGLRQMANVPVESLRSGGLFWFNDLTVPDQFFGLPIITSLTLLATIELGTDSAKLSSQNLQTMKYVLRAIPLVILPFTINFPSAILCYWLASNVISLVQVGFLRVPVVRQYFNIEQMVKHKPENLPIKSKGFVEGLKDSWANVKITKELEERKRLDELQFQRAGRGPTVKTYKYDPTKQIMNNPNAVSMKKR